MGEQVKGEPNQFRPRAVLALGYGFLAPGLGQLYCGRTVRALACVVVPVFGSLLVYNRLFVHAAVRAGLIVLLLVALFQIWSVVDAARCAAQAPAHTQRWFQRWYSIAAFGLLFTLLSEEAFTVVTENFASFRIPSASMEPALEPDDSFIVDRGYYHYLKPKRGDVAVVYTDPIPTDDGAPVVTVKRIVALAGDRIEVRGRTVLLNGAPVSEPYAVYSEGGTVDFPPQQVPAGTVFLLGDNRDSSEDGRTWTPHFTPLHALLGRATVIYFNSSRPARIGLPIAHTGPVAAR